MVNRVVIVLEQPEYSALLKMAVSELRNPQDQIRWLLRRELESRKLLQPHTTKNEVKQNERQPA